MGVETNLSGVGVFQTVGSGAFYLSTNSPYRNAGTNNINPTLLSALGRMTTYPPQIWTGIVTTATSLAQTAARDTNILDLGYHYFPIDWLSGSVFVSAPVTLADGAVLAIGNSTISNVHVQLNGGAQFIASGSALTPARITQPRTVQEQPTVLDASWRPLFDEGTNLTSSTAPIVQFRFADLTTFRANQYYFYTYLFASIELTHSQVRGGDIQYGGFTSNAWTKTFAVTNTLFERTAMWLGGNDTAFRLHMRNALAYGGSVSFSPTNASTAWTVKNSCFDGASLWQYAAFTNQNNAFIWPTTNLLSASNSIPFTNFTYDAGPLGFYYHRTNSLANKGTNTADTFGLYHFTTTTNQVKETNSVVDIGFHYVALNANSTPLDSDNDGLADQYEDMNGNGLVDSGEINWTEPDTDGDGLTDAYELLVTHTDPNNADSNNTGVLDGYKDPDGDGWANLEEVQNGTNPLVFNTPRPVFNFVPRAYTNQSVTLTWSPSPGAVTGYSIQKFDYWVTYAYQEIGQVAANVHSFTDPGPSPVWDTIIYLPNRYRIQAIYTNGLSAVSDADLEPDQATDTVAATLVRGRDGHWSVALSVPPSVEKVRLCWAEWNDFYDYPSEVSSHDILTNEIVNGFYSISNAEAVDHMTDVLYVRGVGPDDLTGYPVMAGNSYSDAPYFVDGSRHMKENLAFMLRSASRQGFHPSVEGSSDPTYGWFNTNGAFVTFSFLHPDLSVEKGYFPPDNQFLYWPFVALDDIWPFYINNVFRQNVYGDSIPAFEWTPDFATVPFPPLLTNNPYFVAQDPGQAAKFGMMVSSNSIFLTNGLKNYFGFSFQDAVVLVFRTNVFSYVPETLTPGSSIYFDEGYGAAGFYNSTVAPELQTVGYYFAPIITPGTLVISDSTWVSRQPYSSPLNVDFAVTNQTPQILTSVGKHIVIGGWAKQRLINGDTNKFVYLGQYFDKAYKADANGNATTNEIGVLSPYGDFFPTEPGPVVLKTKPDIETGEVGSNILNVIHLGLDANHDGVIDRTFAGPDTTSAGRPFRFWINNDADDASSDRNLVGITNCLDSVVNGARDLEDFARLWISGMPTLPSNYTATLSWSGEGSIKLYNAYETNGGIGYLTNQTIAATQSQSGFATSIATISATSSYQFSAGTFSNALARYFLFEGVTAGSGQLSFTVERWGTQVVAQSTAFIELADARNMYERASITNVIITWPEMVQQTNVSGFRLDHEPGYQPESSEVAAFVHGWRMTQWDYDTFSATMFKRLYWQGFNGRFASLRWPTRSADTDTNSFGPIPADLLTFDRSEHIAFKSGTGVAAYLGALRSRFADHTISVCAHSMGGVVMMQALKELTVISNAPIDRLVLMQAAVSAHCFDVTVTNLPALMDFEQSIPTPNTHSNYALGINNALRDTIINFYNPLDFALATARTNGIDVSWVGNQFVKPLVFFGYYYNATNGVATVTTNGWNEGEGVIPRTVSDPRELMPFVARSRSKAVGAQGGVDTVIDGGELNLEQLGFGDASYDHSGQFNRNIQSTPISPFYRQLRSAMFTFPFVP